MKTILRYFCLATALAVFSPLLPAQPLVEKDASAAIAAPDYPIADSKTTLVIVLGMDALFIGSLWVIFGRLSQDDKWSLGSALSEGATTGAAPAQAAPPVAFARPLPPSAPDGTKFFPVPPPPACAAGTTPPNATGTFYDSSTSRLIAFIGMLATVFLFFGFGNWVLWHCLRGGRAPADLTQLIWFLGGGASLFVPYALNQLRGALESLPSANRHA